MPTRPVDLNNIKGRIAEALVESIFRRAEFKMTRFGRESDLCGMMKSGKDDFLRTVDLHDIKRFDLYPQNVQQHEELARKLFGLLSEIKAGILP
jgi:hypothetical protein